MVPAAYFRGARGLFGGGLLRVEGLSAVIFRCHSWYVGAISMLNLEGFCNMFGCWPQFIGREPAMNTFLEIPDTCSGRFPECIWRCKYHIWEFARRIVGYPQRVWEYLRRVLTCLGCVFFEDSGIFGMLGGCHSVLKEFLFDI